MIYYSLFGNDDYDISLKWMNKIIRYIIVEGNSVQKNDLDVSEPM